MSGTADRSPSSRADVCIVGSGVAGALVAAKLAEQGHDVVILEAGPRFDRSENLQRMETAIRPSHGLDDVWEMGGDRDRYTVSGPYDYELNNNRVKGVGGTTLHWGAYTPRLHPKDFEMNSRYGLATDWPISYEDLQPYYVAAEKELGVAGASDNPFLPRDEPFPMPAFAPSRTDVVFAEACTELGIAMHSLPKAINSESYDGRVECQGFSTCKPVCPSGAKYSGDVHVRKAEDDGARVIDRAAVQRLDLSDDPSTLDAAVYATPDGTEYRQEARQFVLAAGGVETPRLLLLSDSKAYPDGLANSSGAVGRYFMDHPYTRVAGDIPESIEQEPIGYVTSQSQQFYEYEEPTPGSIMLTFGYNPDFSPVKSALQGGDMTTQEELFDAIDGDLWGDELLETMRKQASDPGTRLAVFAASEILPHKENTITLDYSRRDEHGNPVPELTLNVRSHARKTMERAIEIKKKILNRAGARNIRVSGVDSPDFGGHMMGTTRMGDDPEESVVNAQTRTHDVRNLWIASSSVFPTGGAANPTLTIAALAIRTAERLDAEL